MTQKEDILLELGINFPAELFKNAYEKSFKDMEKASARATKFGQGKIGDFIDKVSNSFGKGAKTIKVAEQALGKYKVQQQKVQEGITAINGELQVKQRQLRQYERDLGRLSEAEAEAAKESIADKKKEIQAITAKQAALRDLFSDAKKAQEDIADSIEDMKFSFGGEELLKAAGEAGKELAEPFSNLLNKDIIGAGKSFAKLAGKGIQMGLGGLGKGIGGLGSKLTAGADKRAAGGDTGKMTKAMGFVGKVMGGLGSFIQTLSNIGPILGMAGGAIMGLVKMFIDADTQVKEFNKGMISAGGTGQFFSKSIGNAHTKVGMMIGTVKEFRDAANSLKDNLDWGITSDTHKEVLQNLQAEGVSLATMQVQYGDLNAKSASFAKDQGSITQAAVAYSRQMGVSLQEVTSFQAEMVTEMGSTFAGTTDQFRMMAAGAAEAGIASNKFYAMIRGVSADLSLYNTRLEDAVKVLGKLGKIMSPRNASKFMQTMMNAYKGASFQDKVKSSLLAGPAKTAKIVAEDIASKNKTIAEKISKAGGGTVKDIQEALEAGPAGKDTVRKALKDAEAKQDKPLGDLREAVSSLNSEKRMAKGGLVGNARALSKVSMIGAAEHKFAESSHFGGNEGSLQGMAGDALAGLDDETKQMYQNIYDQTQEQREELVKQGKMTEKQAKEASMTEIYDTMDKAQKDAVDGKNVEEEANKRMGTHVQSMEDKLKVLTDFFMNQFYNLVMGIYDAILSIPGVGGGDKKRDLDFMKKMQKNKDPEVQNALVAASGADPGQAATVFADAFIENPTWKSMATFMTKKADSPEEAAKQQAVVDKALQSMGEGQLNQAMQMSGMSPDLRAKLESSGLYETKMVNTSKGLQDRQSGDKSPTMEAQKVWKGGDVSKAMKDANFTPEQMAEVASKLGWASKATGQIDKFVETQGELGKIAGGAAAPEAPAVSAQAAASSKSDGAAGVVAGTPGAAVTPGVPAAGPPVAGGAPAAAPPSDAPPTAKATEKQADVQQAQQEQIKGTLAEVVDALRVKGVRLDKSWMDNHMKKMIEEATLDALRVALLENFMMKELKPDDVAKALANGADPKTLSKIFMGGKKDGKTDADALGSVTAGKNAAGGFVTGIKGGLAQISPAPGEGLASIGKGERIVSADGGGGGGGTTRVELVLKGDLGQLIEAKAQQVVVRHNAAANNR